MDRQEYKSDALAIANFLYYKDRLKPEIEIIKQAAAFNHAAMMLLEAERNEVYETTLEEHQNRVISKAAMLRNSMDVYLASKGLLERCDQKTESRMARMGRKIRSED